jgi:hypothetical protein
MHHCLSPITFIAYKQGDQIWRFFPIGLLLEAILTLCKNIVAERNTNILGYLFHKQFVLHFQLNYKFQTLFVVGIFRFQNSFDVDIQGSLIELFCR